MAMDEGDPVVILYTHIYMDAHIWPREIFSSISLLRDPARALHSALKSWHKNIMDLLEMAQSRTMKMTRELEQIFCEDRMRELGLFILEEKTPERLYSTFQYPKGLCNRA